MKTNLIRASIVILAVVITSSVQAQNTKSFKENKFTYSLGMIVKEKLSDFGNAATIEMGSLKSITIFKPESDYKYEGLSDEDLEINLKELEAAVKFTPASTLLETTEFNNEISEIIDLLSADAKFLPEADSIKTEFLIEDISNELAAVVRYVPES